MKLRLTARALKDLDAICDYIRVRNPQAATRIFDAIEAAFAVITAYPLSGPVRRDAIHRFVLPRYPYLIFYEINQEADAVDVLTIRHAARREED